MCSNPNDANFCLPVPSILYQSYVFLWFIMLHLHVFRLPEENTYEEDMSSKRKKTLSSIPSKSKLCIISFLHVEAIDDLTKILFQMILIPALRHIYPEV